MFAVLPWSVPERITMRCWLKYLVVSSLLVMLGSTTVVAMDDEALRVVEGVGAIVQRNQAAARAQAVHDALRRALEQEVAGLLDPLVLIESFKALEDRLYTQTLKYIRSYRVIWEYPDISQQVYRVGVEADVAVDEVIRVAQALELIQPGEERGRLLVLIVEQNLGRAQLSAFGRDGGVVAQVLRAQLQTRGFHIVSLEPGSLWDGRDGSALTVGQQAKAGIVLVGQARVHQAHSEVAGMSLQTVQAEVQVQALITATGEQLALERAETTVFHADAVLGGTQALEKVAAEVAVRLVLRLQMFQQQYQRYSITPQGVQ
jgi:hypothetical protein